MVRVKRRYILLEVIPDDSAMAGRDLGFDEKQLIGAIRRSVEEMHGDFGLGSILMSSNCKRLNQTTKMAVICVRKDPHYLLLTSLPLVKKVHNLHCTLRVVALSGTHRGCLKRLQHYYKKQNQILKMV